MHTAQYTYTILKWIFLCVCHLFYTTAQALMPAQLTELTATLPLVHSPQILVGMELICFIAAHMVLCFGLVLKQCRQHITVLPVAEQH